MKLIIGYNHEKATTYIPVRVDQKDKFDFTPFRAPQRDFYVFAVSTMPEENLRPLREIKMLERGDSNETILMVINHVKRSNDE